MKDTDVVLEAKRLAAAFVRETRGLPVQNTASERSVIKKYSRMLRKEDAGLVLETARELLESHGFRWQAYELIRNHPGAFGRTGPQELELLGRGINSWWAVDSFARTLAGPAWLRGQVNDALIHSWAQSPDLWWRRAALVSTVALNVRSHGGPGDTGRTLAVCRLLTGDHEDMVVKAMSWALRELAVHDPQAVREFLAEHDNVLAARVKREVRNKLDSGLKNPGKGRNAG